MYWSVDECSNVRNFNVFSSLSISGQKEENSASVTGSTGSVQPSPRFDRRDHGSLQNLVGGGGSGGNSAATPTFLAPASAGFGPTKTNSFPSELYDTPSSHMAGNPAAVAESWYSSPASHRQGSQEIAAASSNTSNTRLSSPGARKASPMKLRTDLAQVGLDFSNVVTNHPYVVPSLRCSFILPASIHSSIHSASIHSFCNQFVSFFHHSFFHSSIMHTFFLPASILSFCNHPFVSSSIIHSIIY